MKDVPHVAVLVFRFFYFMEGEKSTPKPPPPRFVVGAYVLQHPFPQNTPRKTSQQKEMWNEAKSDVLDLTCCQSWVNWMLDLL